MSQAIGMLELSSIAIGHQALDEMLDASSAKLLIARTICSGKYAAVIGGDVSDVQSSLEAGAAVSHDALIDKLIIPNVHPSVFPALSSSVELSTSDYNAMGIIETFTVSAILECADAAAKAADVKLFRIHIAMAIGGKGFLQLTGDVSSVRSAVSAGVQPAIERGVLVSQVVIPNPNHELFLETI